MTAELLGDVGTFTAASCVLKDSGGRQGPLCRRARPLGDSGREDSLLWKEMRNEGLSNRATMEKGGKLSEKAHILAFFFSMSCYIKEIVQHCDILPD